MAINIPVVFVSSTSEELKPYRQAAKEAAVSARFHPEMMEYFVASGKNPPYRACMAKEKVEGADLLVAIVAHRYGWIPADRPGGAVKSITWLECEEAARLGGKCWHSRWTPPHPGPKPTARNTA